MSVAQEPSVAVDLTNCDREPIHVLGAIQPFGFLIAVSSDWLVTRASANVAAFIGTDPESRLGRPAADFLLADALHTIRNRITLLRGSDAIERLFAVKLCADRPPFDVAVHFSGPTVIIEAEPAAGDAMEAATLVRTLIARLSQSDSMAVFLRTAVRQLRAISEFDRVMIYRFDHSGSGEVVAEAVRSGVESFLGLNYPASDIPAQARALYLRNAFRIIADVSAAPVPIVPPFDARGEALDQSLSVLRAVSPIHIEYLRNMGVAASLSISIIVDGKLWGLFACHHDAPRRPSFAQRSAAELFGQMFSMMLESRERHEIADYESKARAVADRLMVAVAQDNERLTDAQWLGESIFDIVPADGVGVYLDGAVALSGLTPNREQFGAIIAMLNRIASNKVYTTDCIGSLIAEAAAYADRAAGMLAIPLSRRPRDYVVLFRAERARSVRWAGNPDKPVEPGPHGDRLTPRKSFEEWSELVRGKAAPFSAVELRVADMLRNELLEVLLRLAEAAGDERRRAQEQQELVIAELNHRVRNILALIRGLVSQTRQSALTTEAFTATLDERIKALARAHDQITADRWGPARLVDLINTEAGSYLAAGRDRITHRGPNILVEPGAFTVLALVLHELMTNAVKYGALGEHGSVEIDWQFDPEGSLLLTWKESGGPAVTAPSRRGFGSTIIERSIPHELSGSAEIRYHLSGLEAVFVVPARFLAGVLSEASASVTQLPNGAAKARPNAAAMPGGGGDTDRPLEGQVVLLVEDSMIIALDGEDSLRDLGPREVKLAATVARAKSILSDSGIAFALLDFNLEAETSLPIADVLLERGVPFLFATGYGDSLDLPDRFRDIGIVDKPYNARSLAAAIASP